MSGIVRKAQKRWRICTSNLIQTTPYHNIDIITANGYLMRTNMNLLLNEKEDQILRFAAAMLEVQDVYDSCVVE